MRPRSSSEPVEPLSRRLPNETLTEFSAREIRVTAFLRPAIG